MKTPDAVTIYELTRVSHFAEFATVCGVTSARCTSKGDSALSSRESLRRQILHAPGTPALFFQDENVDLAQLCLANPSAAPRGGREERRRPPSDVYALLTADRGGIGLHKGIIGGQEQEEQVKPPLGQNQKENH